MRQGNSDAIIWLFTFTANSDTGGLMIPRTTLSVRWWSILYALKSRRSYKYKTVSKLTLSEV